MRFPIAGLQELVSGKRKMKTQMKQMNCLRTAGRAIGLVSALTLLGTACAPPGPAPTETDDGAIAERAGHVTRTPAEWLPACTQGALSALAECTALQQLADVESDLPVEALLLSDEAELAALRINIQFSKERGDLAPLETLLFRSGARAARTVGDWASLDTDAAARVAFDVNRNFQNGLDRGALGEPARTRICGTESDFVDGVSGRECSQLNNPCMSSELVGDCCDPQPRPANTACGAGTCDGTGACQEDAKLRASAVSENAIGYAHWVSSNVTQVPSLFFAPERVLIRLDEEAVVALSRAEGQPVDLSEVRVAGDAAHPASPVAVVAPEGRRTVYLHGAGERATACFVRGHFDELGSVPADCSGLGTTVVQCVEEEGEVPADETTGAEVGCRLSEGTIELEAENIALAWLMQPGDQEDVHTMAIGSICLWGNCGPLRGVCRPGASRRCTGGGTQRCSSLRQWGPCTRIRSPEVCNGVDDDLDGRVDEGTNQECDDGIPCTVDTCFRGACRNRPADVLCGEGPRSACSLDRCMATPTLTDPTDRVTSDVNGCQHVLRDSWCTHQVDGCDCDGAELCLPGVPGTDSAGCGSQQRWDPTAATAHAPCENDEDNCTLELCCETSLNKCRKFRALPPDVRSDVRFACGVAGRRNRSDRVLSETGLPVLCPKGDNRYADPPFDRVNCDDSQPCTLDACVPATGTCVHNPRPDGTHVEDECEGVLNRGCGERMCLDGICQVGPHQPEPRGDYGRESPCLGPVDVWHARLLQPTCAFWGCDASTNTCEQQGDDAICDDGNFCNGIEQCVAPVPRVISEHVTTVPVGCQPGLTPCTDIPSCTEEICDEVNDSCSSVPRDELCPGNNPEGNRLSLCDYTERCDPSVPFSGAAPSGCVPVREGGICDDGDLCTANSCEVLDEFNSICTSTFLCIFDDFDPVPAP